MLLVTPARFSVNTVVQISRYHNDVDNAKCCVWMVNVHGDLMLWTLPVATGAEFALQTEHWISKNVYSIATLSHFQVRLPPELITSNRGFNASCPSQNLPQRSKKVTILDRCHLYTRTGSQRTKKTSAQNPNKNDTVYTWPKFHARFIIFTVATEHAYNARDQHMNCFWTVMVSDNKWATLHKLHQWCNRIL